MMKRILLAQVNDPIKGDFIELVKADFLMTDMDFNVKSVETISVDIHKTQVKKKVREAATYNRLIQKY